MRDSFTDACESRAYKLLISGDAKRFQWNWELLLNIYEGDLVIHFSVVVEIKR